MPELPEVEVTRQGLLPWLPGRTVTAIHWSNCRLRLPLPRSLLKSSILGNTITTIDRRAKYLLLRMTDGSTLVVHLGMTGKLGLFSADAPVERHDHLRLLLDDDRELRFNDQRRFGSITVWPAAERTVLETKFSRHLGLEPLGAEFTAERLSGLACGRRAPVKSFLMNGRLIAGIGNIYANEILHATRLHPTLPARSVPAERWNDLVHHTRAILNRAIAAGGSTIADFLNASGQPGYFQLQLAVYGKQGDPCPSCGQVIVKMVLAGRATFFCPRCQPPP